ncbi:transmembrane protein, putative (macronuclear) [Tetrahymena thermophila SB210]|uniref:Transmembrane protein, putative n=1 Tax=Tetrahymena thermophila (strain SB210) TaxID=312017 RepID=Q22UJ6_TETTS|nr:transmembrane protein, putative [Tetrahymena thermophila SB210]EAR88974.2 transmembrane protein, putative [Tetrahymena thermophila SB210]|eukprot:XP_001009219.2 transmembrane protein, putative [Tetrahymena thermophila SB210]
MILLQFLIFICFQPFIKNQCVQQAGQCQAPDLTCSSCQKPYEDCSQGYLNGASTSQTPSKCSDQYAFYTDLGSCYNQCPSGYSQAEALYECDICYPRQCQQCSPNGCLSCIPGQTFNPVNSSCISNCGSNNQFGTLANTCEDYCPNQIYYYEDFQTMNCQQIEICNSVRVYENLDQSNPPSSQYISHLFSINKDLIISVTQSGEIYVRNYPRLDTVIYQKLNNQQIQNTFNFCSFLSQNDQLNLFITCFTTPVYQIVQLRLNDFRQFYMLGPTSSSVSMTVSNQNFVYFVCVLHDETQVFEFSYQFLPSYQNSQQYQKNTYYIDYKLGFEEVFDLYVYPKVFIQYIAPLAYGSSYGCFFIDQTGNKYRIDTLSNPAVNCYLTQMTTDVRTLIAYNGNTYQFVYINSNTTYTYYNVQTLPNSILQLVSIGQKMFAECVGSILQVYNINLKQLILDTYSTQVLSSFTNAYSQLQFLQDHIIIVQSQLLFLYKFNSNQQLFLLKQIKTNTDTINSLQINYKTDTQFEFLIQKSNNLLQLFTFSTNSPTELAKSTVSLINQPEVLYTQPYITGTQIIQLSNFNQWIEFKQAGYAFIYSSQGNSQALQGSVSGIMKVWDLDLTIARDVYYNVLNFNSTTVILGGIVSSNQLQVIFVDKLTLSTTYKQLLSGTSSNIISSITNISAPQAFYSSKNISVIITGCNKSSVCYSSFFVSPIQTQSQQLNFTFQVTQTNNILYSFVSTQSQKLLIISGTAGSYKLISYNYLGAQENAYSNLQNLSGYIQGYLQDSNSIFYLIANQNMYKINVSTNSIIATINFPSSNQIIISKDFQFYTIEYIQQGTSSYSVSFEFGDLIKFYKKKIQIGSASSPSSVQSQISWNGNYCVIFSVSNVMLFNMVKNTTDYQQAFSKISATSQIVTFQGDYVQLYDTGLISTYSISFNKIVFNQYLASGQGLYSFIQQLTFNNNIPAYLGTSQNIQLASNYSSSIIFYYKNAIPDSTIVYFNFIPVLNKGIYISSTQVTVRDYNLNLDQVASYNYFTSLNPSFDKIYDCIYDNNSNIFIILPQSILIFNLTSNSYSSNIYQFNYQMTSYQIDTYHLRLYAFINSTIIQLSLKDFQSKIVCQYLNYDDSTIQPRGIFYSFKMNSIVSYYRQNVIFYDATSNQITTVQFTDIILGMYYFSQNDYIVVYQKSFCNILWQSTTFSKTFIQLSQIPQCLKDTTLVVSFLPILDSFAIYTSMLNQLQLYRQNLYRDGYSLSSYAVNQVSNIIIDQTNLYLFVATDKGHLLMFNLGNHVFSLQYRNTQPSIQISRSLAYDEQNALVFLRANNTFQIFDAKKQQIFYTRQVDPQTKISLDNNYNMIVGSSFNEFFLIDYVSILQDYSKSLPFNFEPQIYKLNQLSVILINKFECSIKSYVNGQLADYIAFNNKSVCNINMLIYYQSNIDPATYYLIIVYDGLQISYQLQPDSSLKQISTQILDEDIRKVNQIVSSNSQSPYTVFQTQSRIIKLLSINIKQGNQVQNLQNLYQLSPNEELLHIFGDQSLLIFNFSTLTVNLFQNQQVVKQQTITDSVTGLISHQIISDSNKLVGLVFNENIYLISLGQQSAQSSMTTIPMNFPKKQNVMAFFDLNFKRIFIHSSRYSGVAIYDYKNLVWMSIVLPTYAERILSDSMYLFFVSKNSIVIYSLRELKYVNIIRTLKSVKDIKQINSLQNPSVLVIQSVDKVTIYLLQVGIIQVAKTSQQLPSYKLTNVYLDNSLSNVYNVVFEGYSYKYYFSLNLNLNQIGNNLCDQVIPIYPFTYNMYTLLNLQRSDYQVTKSQGISIQNSHFRFYDNSSFNLMKASDFYLDNRAVVSFVGYVTPFTKVQVLPNLNINNTFSNNQGACIFKNLELLFPQSLNLNVNFNCNYIVLDYLKLTIQTNSLILNFTSAFDIKIRNLFISGLNDNNPSTSMQLNFIAQDSINIQNFYIQDSVISQISNPIFTITASNIIQIDTFQIQNCSLQQNSSPFMIISSSIQLQINNLIMNNLFLQSNTFNSMITMQYVNQLSLNSVKLQNVTDQQLTGQQYNSLLYLQQTSNNFTSSISLNQLDIQSSLFQNSNFILLTSVSQLLNMQVSIFNCTFMDNKVNEIFSVDNSNPQFKLNLQNLLVNSVKFKNYILFNNRINMNYNNQRIFTLNNLVLNNCNYTLELNNLNTLLHFNIFLLNLQEFQTVTLSSINLNQIQIDIHFTQLTFSAQDPSTTIAQVNYYFMNLENIQVLTINDFQVKNSKHYQDKKLILLQILDTYKTNITNISITNTDKVSLLKYEQTNLDNNKILSTLIGQQSQLTDANQLKLTSLFLTNMTFYNNTIINRIIQINYLYQLEINNATIKTINIGNQISSPIFASNLLQINLKVLDIENIQNFQDSLITVQQVTFIDISFSKFLNLKTIGSGAAANFTECNQIQLNQNSFLNLKSLQNGGAIVILHTPNSVQLNNNFFIDCSCQSGSGGALYAQNSIFQSILSNQFTGNQALLGSGGAIYLENSDILLFLQNLFENNSAQIGGALRYTLLRPKVLLNVSRQVRFLSYQNTFQNNKAFLYGQDLGSYPTKLIMKGQLNQELVVQDIQSGSQPLKPIEIQFVDEENEVINFPFQNQTNLESSILSQYQQYQLVIKSNNIDLSGILTQQYNYEKKAFIFEVQMIYLPNKNSTFSIQSDSKIQMFTSSIEQNVQNLIINATIKAIFRPCLIGEEQRSIDNHIICFQCPQGYYSILDPMKNSTHQCQVCPQGTVSCQSNQLNLQNGYWRANNETDQVIECDSGGAFCVPEDSNNKFGCLEGHVGPICSLCDNYQKVWDTKYTAINTKGDCAKCSQSINALNMIFYIVLAGIIFGYLMTQIQKQVIICQQKILVRYVKIVFNTIVSRNAISTVTVTFFKQLTSYLQFLMLIRQLQLETPSFSQYFEYAGGNPSAVFKYNLDCFAPQFEKRDVPIYVIRVLWTMVQPLTLFIAIQIVFLLYPKRSYISTQHGYLTFLIIYIFYFPSINDITISALSCRQIGTKSYIQLDFNQLCWDQNHIKYTLRLIAPIFVIVNFIIPAILFIKMNQLRKNLHSLLFKINYQYGYLFQEYKQEAYYWELVKLFIRVSTIFTIKMFSTSVYVQGFIIVAYLSIFKELSLRIQPYNQQFFNQIEVTSLNTIIFTFYILLYANYQNNQIVSQVVWILVYLLNGLFLGKLFFFCVENVLLKIPIFKYVANRIYLVRLPFFKTIRLKFNIPNENLTRKSLKYWKKLRITFHLSKNKDEFIEKFSKKIRQKVIKSNTIQVRQSFIKTPSKTAFRNKSKSLFFQDPLPLSSRSQSIVFSNVNLKKK